MNLRVICDVEYLSDFFRRLALDHTCDGLATHIKKGVDIQIICRLKKIKRSCLCKKKSELERKRGGRRHTRMISNSISSSTRMNSESQSSMSVEFLFRESSTISSL